MVTHTNICAHILCKEYCVNFDAKYRLFCMFVERKARPHGIKLFSSSIPLLYHNQTKVTTWATHNKAKQVKMHHDDIKGWEWWWNKAGNNSILLYLTKEPLLPQTNIYEKSLRVEPENYSLYMMMRWWYIHPTIKNNSSSSTTQPS